MIYLGIDPGKLGGAAVIDKSGKCRALLSFNTKTERGISGFLREWGLHKGGVCCILERVHSMPKQGVKSMFTFGQGYGFLRGVLIASEISFHDVSPQAWMKAIGLSTGGDKKVNRQKAEQIFPQIKVTNAIADALLIAEYARLLLEK